MALSLIPRFFIHTPQLCVFSFRQQTLACPQYTHFEAALLSKLFSLKFGVNPEARGNRPQGIPAQSTGKGTP